MTRREDLKRLTETAVDRFGRLDVLVSNAGTMAVSPFDELRQDDWYAMVATHITGLLNGIGAALPLFRRQRKGASPEAAAAAAQQRDEIAIPPSAIASAIGYAIEQPVGIDISEIAVRPTVQA